MNGSTGESTSPGKRSSDGSTYTVIVDPIAARAIERLPESVCDRIRERIALARHEPFHYFKRLTGRPEYSLRVGDYRIIGTIEGRVIAILAVGHRRSIYEQR